MKFEQALVELRKGNSILNLNAKTPRILFLKQVKNCFIPKGKTLVCFEYDQYSNPYDVDFDCVKYDPYYLYQFSQDDILT